MCLISECLHALKVNGLLLWPHDCTVYFFLEPSLSLTNLTTLLENDTVGDSKKWWYIRLLLNIPESKLDAIERQHSSPDQRSRAFWDLYISEHPFPSWKKVAYALYREDCLKELEVVQKKYLKGE